jgi:hypothetical protein
MKTHLSHMTPEEKLAHQDRLNRLRQRKFYEIHGDRVRKERMIKYHENKKRKEQTPEPEPTPEPIPEPEKNEIDKITDFLNKQDLTAGTRKTRIDDTKRFLWKLTTCTELIECLKNPEKILNELKTAKKTNGTDYSDNTLKIGIQTILYLIDNYPPLRVITKDTKDKYLEFYEIMKVKNQMKVENEKENDEVFNFDVMLRKVKKRYKENSVEYLLMLLYNEFTVRDNFSKLIIKDLSVDDDPETKKRNIFIYDSQNEDLINPVIEINDYKTVSKYGTLKFELKKKTKLRFLILDYIEKKRLKHGDGVFGKSASLNKMVSRILSSVGIDTKNGINALRQSKITTEFNKKKISAKERLELSKRMGHSPITQVNYLRNLKK